MSTSKKLVVSSVFTAIASIVLYCSILFQDFDMIEFDFLPLLLLSAQALLILTIVFIISAILISKGIFNLSKIKKVVITLTSVILVVYILLIGYNGVTFYDGYTPQDLIDNDKVFIQQFFPYCDVNEEESKVDIAVSHTTGVDYIGFYSRGTYENDIYLTYEAEYFETYSCFMNFKFYLEKGILSFSDIKYVNSFTDCETKRINGMNVTIFTKEKSTDIGVFLSKGNRAIYAEFNSYLNASSVELENFIEIVAEQFELIEETADEETFLDIPFSDKFNRRVVRKFT